MIRFIMIEHKVDDFELDKYTNELMCKVQQSLNSNELSFHCNEEFKRSCSLSLADKQYFIDFTMFMTPLGYDQLKIDISTKIKENADKELHALKIKLKDLMIEDWKQCVWLTDHQSEEFAEDLYKNVHSVENGLRRLINTVLSHHLGGDWWSFMPSHLVEKYSKRISGYREKAPRFKNVHANLLSIDTNDLTSILKFKTYRMKGQTIFNKSDSLFPEYLVMTPALKQLEYIMSDIINNDKSIENHGDDLTKLLEGQMEVSIDFWEDFFAPLFPCSLREFSGKWDNFSKDRNHVAHNKLIDDKLHQKFKRGMEGLLRIITEAEEKFEEDLNNKNSEFLEYKKIYEMEQFKQVQRQNKQSIAEQAGIEIMSEDQIYFLFLEHVSYSFERIRDAIYYRTDIEVTYDEPCEDVYEKIFEIKNILLNTSIHVESKVEIDEEEGCTSIMKLAVYYNADLKGDFEISYINGEAEYNDDQGNYMPKISEELDISSLDKLERLINEILEKEMPEPPDIL
ncbi:hypothetical protein CN432_24195 [Bacillus thuringiensis]|uniref:hypothetical protein n=1 Tax=Bacillus TaxID=1386 RepID=UPI000BF5DCF8|nr:MULTISPECIES: hypothetical protein [Bacillus]PEU93979.1 hypothetical protein CN409_21110 [Bacillus sp. AFS012607]PEV42117.1 hypothetical protein CN432_24195 [Bacillus thuringiensis]PGO10928.1 hypothetical protein CN972_03490 [Bacillus thuringiensis]